MPCIQDPNQRIVGNLEVKDVKIVDISGTRKNEFLRDNIDEIETYNKTKNIRDL